MPKSEDLKLVFFGQLTGDLEVEAMVAEYNAQLYKDGLAFTGSLTGPSWDTPLIVMYDVSGRVPVRPVGFVAFTSTKWVKEVGIQGFYMKREYRGLNFIDLLQAIKAKVLKEYPTVRYITWSTHWENSTVRAIAKRIGMKPRSLNYAMDLGLGIEDPRVTSKGVSITA